VLLSGDHAAVERWRAARASEATRTKRPDLIEELPRGSAPGGRE
jgi:tRNA G37 N-methylase TrmD